MTNAIPSKKVQYVKILSLKRLQGYLTYFKQSLSNNDTKAIFNSLKELHKKTIDLKTGLLF